MLTVSPNYAKEIQTPQGGFNLQDFVSAKAASLRLAGILNGIDDCCLGQPSVYPLYPFLGYGGSLKPPNPQKKGALFLKYGLLGCPGWDPAVDPDVFVHFSVEDFEQGKKENKLQLQRTLGLEENAEFLGDHSRTLKLWSYTLYSSHPYEGSRNPTPF